MTVPKIMNSNVEGIADIVDACPVSVFTKIGNKVKITSPKECIGQG